MLTKSIRLCDTPFAFALTPHNTSCCGGGETYSASTPSAAVPLAGPPRSCPIGQRAAAQIQISDPDHMRSVRRERVQVLSAGQDAERTHVCIRHGHVWLESSRNVVFPAARHRQPTVKVVHPLTPPPCFPLLRGSSIQSWIAAVRRAAGPQHQDNMVVPYDDGVAQLLVPKRHLQGKPFSMFLCRS